MTWKFKHTSVWLKLYWMWISTQTSTSGFDSEVTPHISRLYQQIQAANKTRQRKKTLWALEQVDPALSQCQLSFFTSCDSAVPWCAVTTIGGQRAVLLCWGCALPLPHVQLTVLLSPLFWTEKLHCLHKAGKIRVILHRVPRAPDTCLRDKCLGWCWSDGLLPWCAGAFRVLQAFRWGSFGAVRSIWSISIQLCKPWALLGYHRGWPVAGCAG